MWGAPVACHAFNNRNGLTLLIFIVAEIFFIDLGCHLHHFSGDQFFRFIIACKIGIFNRTVFGRGMAETALYAERCFKIIHHFIQIILADMLRKYFQVFPLRGFRWVCGGNTNHNEKTYYYYYEGLFAEYHIPDFPTKLIKICETLSDFPLFCSLHNEKTSGHRIYFYYATD